MMQLSRKELLNKLETLNRQELAKNKEKKAMAKDYSDQIKDIKDEIGEVLIDLEIAE